MASQINISNRKAKFEYELLEKFEAGIQLLGPEIKSIRAGKASIAEAFCAFKRQELYIRNMNVDPYEHSRLEDAEPKRDRKLLLHRQELEKIRKKLRDQGMTVVPLRLYLSDKGIAKVEIAIARGKKIHDKRESIKQREMKRDMDRGR